MDDHALAEDGLIGPSADRHDLEEAVVVDVRHHRADLVDVGGDHDRWSIPGPDSDDVAHLVDGHLVDERLHLGLQKRGDIVLVAGEAVRVGEFLEQGPDFVHVRPRIKA